MHSSIFRFVGIALIYACAGGAAIAEAPATLQTRGIELGMRHEIRSKLLRETRALNVLLPPSYEDGTESYPVIYLLDGAVAEDYHHVSGLVQFLTTYELLPPSILVGIANTDRLRDMTFPTELPELLERAPQAGGSAEFRRFLAEEVKPYISTNLRTNGKSTLIGQSLAGLFATEVFVEEPELFDDFVIVSPSLWWDDYSLLPRIDASLRAHPEKAGTVCILVGSEGREMEGPAHGFAAALAAAANENLVFHHITLPDESHATILHRALYRAFETVYGETHPGM